MYLALITLLGIFLRIHMLGSLPAEMWGDVIVHYDLASQLRRGQPFIHYAFGGDGPLFSYLVSIFPISFNTLLLATAVIGTLVVVSAYAYAYLLFNSRDTALISAFLTAVSFWGITFSRQAKPYILVPLFVSLFLSLLIRKRFLLSLIPLVLGMFSQAAFWGFTPFAYLFFSNSYITTKLSPDLNILIPKLLDNLKNNFLSYWWSQDPSFRHTIPNHPYLDPITGIFFALGLIILIHNILKNKSYSLFFYCLLPFALIQVPSLMDMTPGYSTPNMGRMIGVIPIVFAISAHAINSFHLRLPKLLFILFCIAFINIFNYFFVYPRTLPNGNIPFGKTIAEYIDKNYPASLPVVLSSCCWGDWGQPEPYAIFYRFSSSRPYYYDTFPAPPYILVSRPSSLEYPYASISLVAKQ